MAPVRIKHVVSFTSEDPDKRVINLCTGSDESRPWLCNRADSSGLLKAELQLERASAISYIDVGNFGSAFIQLDVGRSSWPLGHPYVTLLPTATLMNPADSRQGIGKHSVRMFKKADFLPEGAAESWDRIRVTYSQPFNKRCQFGLSFLRLRTAEEHAEEASDRSPENQSTPQKVRSVEDWISSPAVQQTFFGREASPEEARRNPVKLSRAERMVTAAQSTRRTLHIAPQNTLTENDQKPEKNQNIQHGNPRTPRVCKRKPDTSLEKVSMASTPKSKASENSLSGTPKRLGTRNGNISRHSTAKPHTPTSPPQNILDNSVPTEPVCPICGVSYSQDYLPIHASSCLDSGFTETASLSSLHFRPHSSLCRDELMVSCPLCDVRFPTDCIQQHASTCGDFAWVD